MEFRVLGRLEVIDDDGRSLALGGPKQRAALAILILARGRVVSRDAMIDGIWGDASPPAAAGTLDAYVSRLRRVLPDGRLTTQAPGYRLRMEPGELDLERLESDGALDLVRGDPLADLADAPFAGPEIARIGELELQLVERRLQERLDAGAGAELVPELETLTRRHPYREGLWAALMLALYRSDRQADALLAFDRMRHTLDEELGVHPGPPLMELHQRILQHDRTLAAPRRRAPPVQRRLWPRLAALGAAVAAAAIAIIAATGSSDSARPRSPSPGTTMMDARDWHPLATIPTSQIDNPAYPVFAGHRFWVNSFSPAAYVEIEPRTGRLLRRLNPPPSPSASAAEPATLTPFDVSGDGLWVGSGHDLVKISLKLGRVVERFHLDDYVGRGAGLVEGVAVGGGSVWVSRDVGGGQIVRLDAVTGAVEHRFDDTTAYLQIDFGDGALWAADADGVVRIDARTNALVHAGGVRGTTWIAAGGGFGWTSDPRKGVVYKLGADGQLLDTYATGLGAGFMSYADGVLWTGNQVDGTVTGIDAVTGRRTTHRFAHPIGTVAAGDGVVLVSVGSGPTVDGLVDALPGTVARFFSDPGQLGQGDEPALDDHPGALQVARATCATLLRRPTANAALEPEVAAAMPKLSGDSRTYRFRIRPGFHFSPPSGEELTAETFRYSIERALSPRLDDNPTGQIPPGPHHVDDIAGQSAFRAARAPHIAGLRSRGDVLSIELTAPSADFLERISLPYFCPVPRDTPMVAGAPGRNGTIPAAGPYYVTDYANESHLVLRANPTYGGARERRFDAIAIVEGVGASAALDRSLHNGWDGITTIDDPLLAPGGPVERAWGPESAAARRGDQRYVATALPRTRLLAFNTQRGPFVDPALRRAAAAAIDRDALAAVWGVLPTKSLLPPALARRGAATDPGAAADPGARAGAEAQVTMRVSRGCDRCAAAARELRAQLATAGIDVALTGAGHADLVDLETGVAYPDAASFLERLASDAPPGWLPTAAIAHVARLDGPARDAAAQRAATMLTSRAAVVAYGNPVVAQFLGPGIGCRAPDPFAHGVDLAGLCPD
jgi:DNA-binding SARP family transcriptional activator/ABC-type transport system substrate-binding protein